MILTCILLFSYITVSHVEMREKPLVDSEVVSEAYFSEPINVVEESGEWAKITTAVDKYQGWVKKGVYCSRQDEYPKGTIAKVTRLVAHVYDREDISYGPMVNLPFESRL